MKARTMTNPAATYMRTVNRLEPDISPVDTTGALTSIAISLKRIADAQEEMLKLQKSIIYEGCLDVRTGS